MSSYQVSEPRRGSLETYDMESSPTIAFAAWRRELYTIASKICAQHYANGLISFHVLATDAEWEAAMAAYPVLADADITKRPIPEDYKDTLLRIATSNKKTRRAVFQDIVVGIQQLTEAMLQTVGLTIRSTFQHHLTGYAEVKPWHIMQRVTQLYGRLTTTDIRHIGDAIGSLKIESVDKLFAGTTWMKQQFMMLQLAGQPKSSADQFSALERAVAHLPTVAKCLSRFARANVTLDLEGCTFDGAVDYLQLHSRFLTPTVSDLGYAQPSVQQEANHAGPQGNGTAASKQHAQQKQPQADKKQAQGGDGRQAGHRGQGGGGHGRPYCHLHQYKGQHTSAECPIMNIYRKELFTDADRAAVDPKGGKGSN